MGSTNVYLCISYIKVGSLHNAVAQHGGGKVKPLHAMLLGCIMQGIDQGALW